MKPELKKMWATFPDHDTYPTLKDLYTMLGGQAERNINEPGFGVNGNTCASRLSVAFNRGGAPISFTDAEAIGAGTLKAGDKSYIIFRVADFKKYLRRTLGPPTTDNTPPFDSAFRGKKGIIAFTVNWTGATGHIALWNGTAYREPDHDDYSSYVAPENQKVKTTLGEFWELS
jgi:hypothetical protein